MRWPTLTDDHYRTKLMARGTMQSSGCFEWQGHRNWYNYGETCFRAGVWIVSRLAWHLWRGPIPTGIRVLHKCDNPACFNVAHLFLGTPQANTLDMVRKGRHHYSPERKTHCVNGHEFTAENIYRAPSRPGKRQCRQCMRDRHRLDWQQNREGHNARQRMYRAKRKERLQANSIPSPDAQQHR